MMDVSALCLSPFLLMKQSLFEAKNKQTDKKRAACLRGLLLHGMR